MKKQKFVELIRNNKIDKEDLNALIELEKIYPYSQAIHHLIAKSSIDLKSKDAKSRLNKAALYATDRAILKAFIENKIDFGDGKNEMKTREAIEEIQQPSTDRDAIVALRKEVLNNLKELQITKKHYLNLFEEKYPDVNLGDKKDKSEFKVSTKKAKTTTNKTGKKKTSKLKTSKKASVKAANSAKITKGAKGLKTGKTAKASKSKEKKNPKIKSSELENIVNAKSKSIHKPSVKQKEQINIIDQFIEANPKIEAISDDEKSPVKDLSKNSQQFNDDLISENLAQIMEKQGKTQQAINIYKKLIWKFPQKKSFFASQIDKLRKD